MDQSAETVEWVCEVGTVGITQGLLVAGLGIQTKGGEQRNVHK
jgi:hypothetical protein